MQLIADTPAAAAYLAWIDETTGQLRELRSPRFADYEAPAP
jgi:hypothetical protein